MKPIPLASRIVRTRVGFTIMEVMVALALLATAMTALMSQWAGLHDMRRVVQDKQKAQAALAGIVERLISVDGVDLGTIKAPWSQSRFFDRQDSTTTYGRLPLSEDAPLDSDNMIKQGLLVNQTGLRRFRVYIEYYRVLKVRPTDPDLLLDTADATSAAFRTRFSDPAVRLANRITVANPLSTVGEDDPVLIRVLATWQVVNTKLLDANSNGVPDNEEDDDPSIPDDKPTDSLPNAGYLELFLARRS